MAVGRSAAAALVAFSVAAALGCGGSSKPSPAPLPQTVADDRGPTPPVSDLALPPGVPDESTGPATNASRRVINNWLKALRRGDVKRAAHYFALPSKFQNATPVLTVNSEQERIAVNVSLSCGAVATEMGGAGVYTIVKFRLTKRPGGNCGTGVGGTVRGAIRVERHKIKEWYRLPDQPGGQQQAPPAPAGPAV
jgi:limonene-1,2-epoxide hydrolase